MLHLEWEGGSIWWRNSINIIQGVGAGGEIG